MRNRGECRLGCIECVRRGMRECVVFRRGRCIGDDIMIDIIEGDKIDKIEEL